jgi:hypothetical protein
MTGAKDKLGPTLSMIEVDPGMPLGLHETHQMEMQPFDALYASFLAFG